MPSFQEAGSVSDEKVTQEKRGQAKFLREVRFLPLCLKVYKKVGKGGKGRETALAGRSRTFSLSNCNSMAMF